MVEPIRGILVGRTTKIHLRDERTDRSPRRRLGAPK